ncbi:MAG TPA: hypothetical protein VGA46_07990 [Methyloceanibacter sp.]|jgi:hypothetical protein
MIAINIARLAAVAAVAILALLVSGQSMADTHSGYLVDHGVAVYYAVIPAEMIRGHAKQHPEATMHGGPPNRPHVHHIMVALFDAASLERIVDAQVSATVGEVGLAGRQKKLEPFTVAGALTYGNYFDMQPNTNYRVAVDVKRLAGKDPARVEFEFKHQ